MCMWVCVYKCVRIICMTTSTPLLVSSDQNNVALKTIPKLNGRENIGLSVSLTSESCKNFVKNSNY